MIDAEAKSDVPVEADPFPALGGASGAADDFPPHISSKWVNGAAVAAHVPAEATTPAPDNSHGDGLEILVPSSLAREAEERNRWRTEVRRRDEWDEGNDGLGDGYEQQANIDSNSDSDSDAATDTPAVLRSINRRGGRIDLAKMRGRWWTAVREKKAAEAEAQAREITEDSSSCTGSDGAPSSSESSDSDSDLSDTYLSHMAKVNLGRRSPEEPAGRDGGKVCPPIPASKQAEAGAAAQPYLKEPHPLHAAVAMDDGAAVAVLLSLPPDKSGRDTFVSAADVGEWIECADTGTLAYSAVQLAAHLDLPHLLRLMLDGIRTKVPALAPASVALSVDASDEERGPTALAIAAAAGSDSAVRVLLSYGARLGSKERGTGDSPLHRCCRTGQPSTLRLLLGAVGRGGGGENRQVQRRLVMLRNRSRRTPLHVACEEGRTDMVEAFLEATSASGAAGRALCAEDNAGRTPLLAAVGAGASEATMALLMWRGNYQQDLGRAGGRRSEKGLRDEPGGARSAAAGCPLVLAVSTGSIEMVRLLLEFGDPSSSAAPCSFDLNGALIAALSLGGKYEELLSDDWHYDDSSRLELLRLLVESGADPHAPPSGAAGLSPLSLSAYEGDSSALEVLLGSSEQVRASKRRERRHDPLLQKHYDVIEARENQRIEASLQDTLVRTLYLGWNDRKGGAEGDAARLRSSVSCYRKGVVLSALSLARLEKSLRKGKLALGDESTPCQIYFQAHYYLPVDTERNKSECIYGYWSKVLKSLPWMDIDQHKTATRCQWMVQMDEKLPALSQDEFSTRDNLCFLITEDAQLLAHKSVISRASAKLEAAVSFAYQSSKYDEDAIMEIRVNAASWMIKLFLQHCYHGSFFMPLPMKDDREHCKNILELALMADEFLCPSLVLECEMRLLASDPNQCYCWSCCKSVERSSPDASLMRCSYMVSGNSRLIGPSTAIDVLAIWTDLNSEDGEYRLMVQSVDQSEPVSVPSGGSFPFSTAAGCAARVMLQDFRSVMKSDAYLSHLYASMEEEITGENGAVEVSAQKERVPVMLVQTCLDIISSSW